MTLPDIDALPTYGGAMNDYGPIVDPTTDEAAKYRNMYAANVAMMTHTIPRAIVCFVGADGANPTDPVSGFVHDALWGNTPAVKPTKSRIGEGIWLLTWPATVSSELTSATPSQGGGVTHSVLFRRALARVECVDGVLRHATAEIVSANSIGVRGFLANGTPDDLPGSIISVWVF